jgi:2-iminoacetate synthase ThiH
LEKDNLNLIDWFTSNQMKVNPDKFQTVVICKSTQSTNISFNLNGNIIKTEDEVTIDYELKFNSNITNICRKSCRY